MKVQWNCRRTIATLMTVAAVVYMAKFASAQTAASNWKDTSNRATLKNGALEASFQAGLLYSLKDLATGKLLISVAPESLPSQMIVFDTTPTDLDTCKVAQKANRDSVSTSFTAKDGSVWQTRWSILPGKGDLVLRVSGSPAKPIEQFRVIFPGCDITERSVVWANVYGVGRTAQAPWTGNFLGDPEKDGSPGGHPQPLVALFQGRDSGWVVEGRDPKIAPANILVQGHGETATLGMFRRFPVPSKAPEMYEIRFRTYKGQWENGVDPYVEWMEKGAGFVPFEKQSPSWIKDIETQAYIEIGNYAALEQLAKEVDPRKTYLGRQPGFTKYGFDMGFPDYTVTDSARKWIKHARKLGFHVGVHFNGRSLSVMWPELVERFKPGFQVIGKNEDGTDKYASIYQGPNELFRVSAAYKPWRDYLVAQLKDAVDAGVDVIYLDETMGTEGKYVVDGVNGLEGTRMLMKQVMDTYPGVAVQTEQFNPNTARHAALALSQMPLGHPLAGYILRRYLKVVPEGIMYSPVDEPIMDAFDSWGYMLPGGSSGFRESAVEITQAYQKYGLKPDARMPRYTFTKYDEHFTHGVTPAHVVVPPEGLKLFGLRGRKGVTAYFEKHPTWRALVVYEPGKEPQRFGTRYTGLTSYEGAGLPVYFYFRHTVRDWLIYDEKGLKGLNPKDTYWFDKKLKPSPTRFHVTSIPADFTGIIDNNKRIPPQEIGEGDSFFQLTFRANGTMNMVVPDDYDVFLNGDRVPVDRVKKTATVEVTTKTGLSTGKEGPGYVMGDTTIKGSVGVDNVSVLLAVKRETNELNGLWRSLPWKKTLDSLTIVEPNGEADFGTQVGGIARISGRLPNAKSIRIQGSYQMSEDGPGPPGDGVVRINGKEVLRIDHGARPYPRKDFDVDISSFAGQSVLFEFLSDGWPGRTSSAVWTAPRIVTSN